MSGISDELMAKLRRRRQRIESNAEQKEENDGQIPMSQSQPSTVPQSQPQISVEAEEQGSPVHPSSLINRLPRTPKSETILNAKDRERMKKALESPPPPPPGPPSRKSPKKPKKKFLFGSPRGKSKKSPSSPLALYPPSHITTTTTTTNKKDEPLTAPKTEGASPKNPIDDTGTTTNESTNQGHDHMMGVVNNATDDMMTNQIDNNETPMFPTSTVMEDQNFIDEKNTWEESTGSNLQQNTMETSNLFATFDTNFETNFPTSQEEQKYSEMYDYNMDGNNEGEYEPPPSFPLFASVDQGYEDHFTAFPKDPVPIEEEDDDDGDWNDLPAFDTSVSIQLKSYPLFDKHVHQNVSLVTRHPWNRNLIVCSELSKTSWTLKEIQPATGRVVHSTNAIQYFDLLNNVGEYTYSKIMKHISSSQKLQPVTIASGVHRQQGHFRVRVAVLFELAGEKIDASPNDAMHGFVAVWQWGYASGTSPVALKNVLSVPTSSQNYVHSSLSVADGLLFLASKENKIYIAKPHVRSGWSTAILNKADSKITSIAVTSHHLHRNFKYLAVTMQNGFTGIWTYDLAVTTNRLAINTGTGDKNNASKNLVQPFCRLMKTEPNCGESHSCQWLPSSIDNLYPFPILAVNFGNHLAIYNVSLPRDQTSASDTTESRNPNKTKNNHNAHVVKKNSINDAVELRPILSQDLTLYKDNDREAELDANDKNNVPFCSWLCLGHRVPPCLTVGFNQSKTNKTALSIGAICLPSYDKKFSDDSKANWLPLWKGELNCESGDKLVSFDQSLALPSKDKHEWIGISLSTSTKESPSNKPSMISLDAMSPHDYDNYFSSLVRPVLTSSWPGFEQYGNLVINNEQINVYHMHTVIQSQVDPSSGNWSTPTQRHFLCASQILPTISSQYETSETQITSTSNATNIVSEFTYSNSTEKEVLIPHRVVVSPRNSLPHWCVILLLSLSTENWHHDEIDNDNAVPPKDIDVYSIASTSPVSFTIVEASCDVKNQQDNNCDSSKIHHGKDVIILEKDQNENTDDTTILVLDVDGVHMHTLEYSSPGSKDDNDERTSFDWIRKNIDNSVPYRALTYNEAKDMLVRNLFLHNDDLIYYVVQRRSDNRIGLSYNGRWKVAKNALNIEAVTPKTKRSDFKTLWMDTNEDIITVISLPLKESNKYASIALSTTSRTMIIDVVEFKILCQTSSIPVCGTLIPIGSDCVAFSCRCSTTSAVKVKYLSCLSEEKTKQWGVISTVPSCRYSDTMPFLLIGIIPDRIFYLNFHSSYNLVDNGEDNTKILLPIITKQPVFLLEPFVANALCSLNQDKASMSLVNNLLKHLFEKFGRKSSAYPYQDQEGIGVMGTGLSLAIQDMLKAYNCKDAATFLLLGNSDFNITKSKILPQWAPLSARITPSNDCCENNLHCLVNGDMHLSEYLQDPESNIPSQMPRTTDTASLMAHHLALHALKRGDAKDAMKYLDFSGSSQSEQLILQIVLSSQLLEYSPGSTDTNRIQHILQRICGSKNISSDSGTASENLGFTTSTIASLVGNLKERERNGELILDEGECGKVRDSVDENRMRHLAPTLQKTENFGRVRSQLLSNYDGVVNQSDVFNDQHFESRNFWSKQSLDESKHTWSTGPSGNKENLLLLDGIEEWLGRCRSNVLGKEGAELAAETGTRTLADILAAAANGRQDHERQISDDESNNSFQDGWVDGVGEGRTDDDNLSVYFRFSEGADEDSTWRNEGVMDLSTHQQKGVILNAECITIEATTSNVDEGESGKVKLLHDIVFNDMNQRNGPSGLYLEVKRGGSLDVGILHDSEHITRQRFSLEFWYHLPRQECVEEEIILARRSICFPGEDISKVCQPLEKDGMLWELVVLPSGWVEFRTCSKSVISSYSGDEESAEVNQKNQVGEDSDDENEHNAGLVGWERENGYGGWNHACLTFSSRNLSSLTDCVVTLYMRGEQVASGPVSVEPPGLETDQLSDIHEINSSLEKTALMFGVGAVSGFRMTEIRGWACERSPDDIKMMMYECLKAAETRKKIKIIIRNKDKEVKANNSLSTSSVRKLDTCHQDDAKKTTLAAPLIDSRRRRSKNSHDITDSNNDDNFSFSANFASVDKISNHENLNEANNPTSLNFPMDGVSNRADAVENAEEMTEIKKEGTDTGENIPIQFGSFEEKTQNYEKFEKENKTDFFSEKFQVDGTTSFPIKDNDSAPKGDNLASIGDTSIVMTEEVPLSKQVRNSAAAAIVRGPPATRHFGGNRGGLLILPELEFYYKNNRYGIGSIAICGAEKTVIYTHGQSPPGKTHPIGASGAIISDMLDRSGNEYLCCFLAKDKRMVVFELRTKTVVVELQMTTKLNFWRYLPPVTHGMTLVYMLITPVGGFHWMPLSDTPRPRQAWKRGPELQGKKIISYEEGGHNGGHGSDSRSRIALLLVSTATVGAPVEAWCLPIFGDSQPLCMSPNILGGAFLLPHDLPNNSEAFDPYIITASQIAEDIVLEVHSFSRDEITGSISKGDLVAGTLLDISMPVDLEVTEPAMAMGTAPAIFCLCCQNYIVVIVRSVGAFASYKFTNDGLIFSGKKYTNRYVIDAAIRPDIEDNESVEVVALLCEEGNPKDGRIVTFTLS